MIENKSTGFFQPLRVLVVEDSQIDRRILESMLSESSSTISFLRSASTLEGAMKLLAEHEFDVVILDLNLPDSEGEETVRRLNVKYPQVAIVINTGAYEDELGLHTLGYGAQDFLVKGKYTAYVLHKALHYALERKRLELELTTAYERLKDAQFQLLQMEKMKVVGALASGIAHDVKNPLATILYGITYLSEQMNPADENARTTLSNMKEAIDRANGIINDLLSFSGMPRVDKRVENLNTVVEKSLSLVHHAVEVKHIEVVKRFDQAIPVVKIDRTRIEQVFVNLILNAVEAMSAGGRLELKTYYETLSGRSLEDLQLEKGRFKPGQTVVVCDIEDNGQGIPKDCTARIFDPFFTTKQESGGVGLGLSVSKDIMESHDGGIFVENKPRGGVRARIVFKSEGVSFY